MTTATFTPVLAANFAEVAVAIIAGAIGVGVFVFVAVMAFKGAGVVFGRLGTYIGGMFSDTFRFVGAWLTAMVYVPMTVFCVIIGRWSAARHYGSALGQELGNAGRCIYRLSLGHLTRLFGVQAAVQGFEQRVPEVIAEAPGADLPKARVGQFDGYTIIGSLAGGGSGGKLYVAEPEAIKAAALERGGHKAVDQVVIKCFSLRDGSSLPQIVRESRALDAAKRLGLVLDHELTPERFFYVMRYVPGQSLSLVVQQLHAASPPSSPPGLDDRSLKTALGYVGDLLATLDTYHKGGLWHKDVKPDNIIVDGKSAHLVDFGLVTPLRSAMTLTTHGTEYFRDPEMVRLALRGVKVQDVDGTRFDIYAVGAVLYAVVENSFPAHGVLSQVSQRCPEALKWIIRRAMTDYDKRYPNPGQMLADLRLVLEASDPMAVKPGHLPSMRAGAVDPGYSAEAVALTSMALAAQPNIPLAVGSGPTLPTAAASLPPGAPPRPGIKPKIRVTNWWTGKFETDSVPGVAAAVAAHEPAVAAEASRFAPRARPVVPAGSRASAQEQLQRARSRAESARGRAQARLGARAIARQFKTTPNGGVFMAAGIFIAGIVLLSAIIFSSMNPTVRHITSNRGGPSPTVEIVMPGGFAMTVQGNDVQTKPIDYSPESPVAANGPKPLPQPAAKPTAPAEPIDATILVMIDTTLATPRDATQSAQINERCKALESRGAAVASETAEDPEDRNAYDECRAQLLAAVSTPIDTDSARQAVQAWMQHNPRFDAIVWVSAEAKSTDASKPRELRYSIFPRIDKDTMSADEQAHRVSTANQIHGTLIPAAAAKTETPKKNTKAKSSRRG